MIGNHSFLDSIVMCSRLRQTIVVTVASLVFASALAWLAGTKKVQHALPNERVESADGHSVRASLGALHDSTWWDCGLVILENGISIGKRVSSVRPVSEAGGGRYWINDFRGGNDDAYLYFSASDNTAPRVNGRQYSIELDVPRSRLAGLPVHCVSLIFAAAWFIVWAIVRSCLQPLNTHGSIDKTGFGIAFLLGVCAFAVSSVELKPLRGQVSVDGEQAVYPLPSWYRGVLKLGRIAVHRGETRLRFMPSCLLQNDRRLGDDEYTTNSGTPLRVVFSTTDNDQNLRVSVSVLSGKTFFMLLVGFCWVAVMLRLARANSKSVLTDGARRLWADICAVGWGGYVLLLLVRFVATPVSDPMAMNADFMNYASWSLTHFDSVAIHPVGVSLLASVARLLQVPWSIFAVMMLWVSTIYLVESLQCILGYSARLVLAMLLLILPDYFTMLSLFGSETALAIASNVALGAVIRLVSIVQPDNLGRSTAALGFALVLWTLSRTEWQLVVVTHVMMSTLIIFRNWQRGEARCSAHLLLMTIPLLMIFTADGALRLMMFGRQGIYAAAALEGPGLMRLMAALYRIESTEKVLFAPVTRRMLEHACDNSRVLECVRSELLDPMNEQTQTGASFVGVQGEPGPFLNWLLPTVFWKFGIAAGDACMGAAADELDLAMRQGEMRSRRAMFPLDPNVAIWIDRLPGAVLSAITQPMRQSWVDSGGGGGAVGEFEETIFDLALGRRSFGAWNERPVVLCEFSGLRYPNGTTISLRNPAGAKVGDGIIGLGGRCRVVLRPLSVSKVEDMEAFFYDRQLGELIESLSFRPSSASGDAGLVWECPALAGVKGAIGEGRIANGRFLPGYHALDWKMLSGRFYVFALMGFFLGSVFPADRGWICAFWIGVCCIFWWFGRAVLVGLIDAMLAWGVSRYMGSVGAVAAIAVLSWSFCLGGAIRFRVWDGAKQ